MNSTPGTELATFGLATPIPIPILYLVVLSSKKHFVTLLNCSGHIS